MNKKFKHKEPFKGLFTQGMVCHQTYKDKNNNWLSPEDVITNDDINFYNKKNESEKIIVGPSESMSKSKKNTIDPENIIKNYGADAVRLFILSDSPPEKDIQWSEKGMVASFKFLPVENNPTPLTIIKRGFGSCIFAFLFKCLLRLK